MQQPKLNATIAKARALYGKRLKQDDYIALAHCRNVSDVAEYLYANTYYGEALSGVDLRSVHRGYLESIIRTNSLERYLNLCNFQKLSNLPFFDFYLRELEISELMRYVMYMNVGAVSHFISSVPNYVLENATFDIHALSKATTDDELLEVLKHTPYCDIIKNAGYDANGKINYPRCEVLLRTYYLSELGDIVKRTISGSERDELLMQIKQQVDLINIINSYRLKTFFNLDNEKLVEHMLPFKGRMTATQKNELMSSQNGEEFVENFSKSVYGRQLGSIKSGFFEENINRLRAVSAKRGLMSAKGVSLCLYCLKYLFDIEAENIVTIIEAIRYGKSPDVTLNYVIY